MTRDYRSHSSASTGLTHLGGPARPRPGRLQVHLSCRVPACVRLGILPVSAADAMDDVQAAGLRPPAAPSRWRVKPPLHLAMRRTAGAGSCGGGRWTA